VCPIPGVFGWQLPNSDYVGGFNCTGGEMTIALCAFNESGECEDRSSNYASVLCSKFSIDSTGTIIDVMYINKLVFYAQVAILFGQLHHSTVMLKCEQLIILLLICFRYLRERFFAYNPNGLLGLDLLHVNRFINM